MLLVEEISKTEFEGDGFDYQILHNCSKLIKNLKSPTLEIGVRAGGGTSTIISSLVYNQDFTKAHIGIDPYGNILYKLDDKSEGRLGYDIKMKNKFLSQIYKFCSVVNYNFIFLEMPDYEFFEKYVDGIWVNSLDRIKHNQYSLVHVDGPHDFNSVLKTFEFFKTRIEKDGFIIFDDIDGYEHNKIHELCINNGFVLSELGIKKAAYIYKQII